MLANRHKAAFLCQSCRNILIHRTKYRLFQRLAHCKSGFRRFWSSQVNSNENTSKSVWEGVARGSSTGWGRMNKRLSVKDPALEAERARFSAQQEANRKIQEQEAQRLQQEQQRLQDQERHRLHREQERFQDQERRQTQAQGKGRAQERSSPSPSESKLFGIDRVWTKSESNTSRDKPGKMQSNEWRHLQKRLQPSRTQPANSYDAQGYDRRSGTAPEGITDRNVLEQIRNRRPPRFAGFSNTGERAARRGPGGEPTTEALIQQPNFSKARTDDGSVDQFRARGKKTGSASTRLDVVGDPTKRSPTHHQTWRADKGRFKARSVPRSFDLAPDDVGAAGYQKPQRASRKKDRMQGPPTPIALPPFISVQNLAIALKQRPEEFVLMLEELGFVDVAMENILNAENAGLVAMEFNYEPIAEDETFKDLEARPAPTDKMSLPERPPIITVMGHVDHGKTTLLDYMRKSSVAASEHGGITQHIGAFIVPLASGKSATFLDTPGHAAFLSMRERGANVTDIVILVVAADDSVKPQTVEAIKHAKNAKVPVIVAINKIDKDGANPQRVKQDLMINGIDVEDLGGDIQAVEVSGKTGQGIMELEEATAAQAELLNLRAETDGPVEGWVLEASTTKAGRVATVLVRRGTLSVGDTIVAGRTWARVRSLRNEAGMSFDSALPGTPVAVDGWRDQPVAGDEVLQATGEAHAADVVKFRENKSKREQATLDMEAIINTRREDTERRKLEKEANAHQDDKVKAPTRSTIFNTRISGDQTELAIVIKADVSGSVEAVAHAIESLPLGNQPVSLYIVRSGVGSISESDIDHLASASSGQAIVLNFNQEIHPHMLKLIEQAGITVIDENIIYNAIDRVRVKIEQHLPPIITSRVLGELDIAQVFDVRINKKQQKVAGCRVRNGVVSRHGNIRVYRGSVADAESLVFQGTLSSLRSHKTDVEEIRKGSECGVGFEGWAGFEPGDVVQCYEEISTPRRLM